MDAYCFVPINQTKFMYPFRFVMVVTFACCWIPFCIPILWDVNHYCPNPECVGNKKSLGTHERLHGDSDSIV